MNQLTIRGFDERLEYQIRRIAEREHISLNKAALKLMCRGAGLDRDTPNDNAIGDRLDDFIGSWSRERAREFEQAVAVFEEIDLEQWQ